MVALSVRAFADEQSGQQILGLSLGQSAADPSALGDPAAAFGPAIAKDIKSIAFANEPMSNYRIELTDSRTLRLWFDAAAKGRPIFWIALTQGYDPPPVPADQYDRIVRDLGNALDYHIAGPTGAPLGALLIKIDPALPNKRRAAVRRHIDEVVANRPNELGAQDDPSLAARYRRQLHMADGHIVRDSARVAA